MSQTLDYVNISDFLFNDFQTDLIPNQLPTDFSNQLFSQHEFDNTQHIEDNTNQAPKRKRTREVKQACDACRSRHLKCDGMQPCQRCSKKSLQCAYQHVPAKKGPSPGKSKEIERQLMELTTRMKQLEEENESLKLLASWNESQTTSSLQSPTNSSPISDSNFHTKQIVCVSPYRSLQPSMMQAYYDAYVDTIQPMAGLSPPATITEFIEGQLNKKNDMFMHIVLATGATLYGNEDHRKELIPIVKSKMANFYECVDPYIAAIHGMVSHLYAANGFTDESFVHQTLAMSKGKVIIEKDQESSMACVAILTASSNEIHNASDVDRLNTLLSLTQRLDNAEHRNFNLFSLLLRKVFMLLECTDPITLLSWVDEASLHIPNCSSATQSTFKGMLFAARAAVYFKLGLHDMTVKFAIEGMNHIVEKPWFRPFGIGVLSVCSQLFSLVNREDLLEKSISTLQRFAKHLPGVSIYLKTRFPLKDGRITMDSLCAAVAVIPNTPFHCGNLSSHRIPL